MSLPVSNLHDGRQHMITIEVVSPETARNWLGHNTHNRVLRKQIVSAYARDMKAGRWEFDGTPIRFALDGTLLDGQHRLQAIVESNTTQTMAILRGLDPKSQVTMDSGIARKAGDQITLVGKRNGSALSAAAKAVLTGGGIERGNNRVTMSEQLSVLELDPSIEWIVNEVLPILSKGLRPIMTPTVAFYAYWRLNQIDPEATAQFFEEVASMTNLPPGSPIIALQRRLVGNSMRGSSWKDRTEALACIFRAWNAWRSGESLQRIQLTYGEFGRVKVPEPV